ncbi:GDSL esterase/lipase [Trifolium repens]|nr:GDSL esterase/lipase [Trifolium repens]
MFDVSRHCHITQNLGLPYLSAYLESVGSNFSNGANFATAGSTIRPQNKTLSQSGYSPISLNVQLVEYSDFKTKSMLIRKKGGVFKKLLPKEEYFSKALYTFDIGHNDITAGYNLNMTTKQVKAFIPDVLGQFSDVIRSVYKEGGRSFWIHNVGPLGCLAYMLDRYPMNAAQTDKFSCAKLFNEVSQYFNHKLNETVVQLREELPKATIIYVDVYTVKYNLISHAQKYGFDEKSVIACCGHGGKYNFNNLARCGATKIVNGEKIVIAKSCKDPSVKIIWDGIHYTEAAKKWIFEQIANGKFSDPPISLKIVSRGNRAGVFVKKEVPVNFLTDPQEGRLTLRLADVLVYGWIGGKHACVDVTGVSPLVGLRTEDFIAGQAALKAASNKVVKHEKACYDNQHTFIPFAFDTFGFLAPYAVDLLQRVQKIMHNNVVSPRSMDVVFKRIGFAIQKGLAAQLVARLPFTYV